MDEPISQTPTQAPTQTQTQTATQGAEQTSAQPVAQTPAQTQLLTERFESDRTHLRSVAYRMLGSLSEAEDALQDAWLRASRADIGDVENLGGWLTTVVARVCLNMLRSRRTRGEDPLDELTPDAETGSGIGSGTGSGEGRPDPEQEAVMADSVGHALLVVLDTLAPAERLAFVLHDMFAVPFDQIAPMIEKTPATARQLASRARRRVRGATTAPDPDLSRRRQVAEAFLAATRGGNFEALVTLLHPDVVLRADKAVGPSPEPIFLGGAVTVAKAAMAAVGRARFTGVALVDGAPGLTMAPYGRLRVALRFTVVDDVITEIDVIAEPERLRELEIAVADPRPPPPVRSPIMHISADALLFDSDETLVSSMRSVVRAWTSWAEAYGMTLQDVARVEVHGRPAAAIVAELLPAAQVAEALARLEDAEVADALAGGVEPVPGAPELLAALPADRWAVVTSGTRRVAEARLTGVGIHPRHLVTVDDITHHKPHPEPFLLAAERLGVAPSRCLVVEDAPAGLASGRAAGMRTIALTRTHKAEELDADFVIEDLTSVSVRVTGDGLEVAVAQL